jgi:hypothetical protein
MTLLLRYSLVQISECTVTFGCNGEKISTNIWSFWFGTGFLQQFQMGEKEYMSELGIPKLQGHVWVMTWVKYSSLTWWERVIYISRNLCTVLLRSPCCIQSSYWKCCSQWNGLLQLITILEILQMKWVQEPWHVSGHSGAICNASPFILHLFLTHVIIKTSSDFSSVFREHLCRT